MTMTESAIPCAPPADCGCGCGGTCGCSDPIGLERTRFYPRQLIGPDELTQDQRWIRDKLRRHNRLLHGWGVVCGCDIRQAVGADGSPVPWTIVVTPGDVLGPFGDEIVVEQETTFDVRVPSTPGFECPPPADPWCSDVHVARQPRQTSYVAIRYAECMTRPVQALGGCSCGCDVHECEYSRIRETFSLTTLEELPTSYLPVDAEIGEVALLAQAVRCSPRLGLRVRPCPPCPTDPWVVLADVVADADGLLSIDPIGHRRYVASFGSFAFSCGSPKSAASADVWTPAQKSELANRLDSSTMAILESRHGGSLSAVETVRVVGLKGVGPRSVLGRFLGTRSIGEVAGAERAAFQREATAAGVPAARAADVWAAANDVITTAHVSEG